MDTKAAFEKAWKERYGYELRWEAALSGYRYKNENAAWWAWQQSRAEIEIDLESVGYMQVEEGTFYLDEGSVEAVLTSHGIRIKGTE